MFPLVVVLARVCHHMDPFCCLGLFLGDLFQLLVGRMILLLLEELPARVNGWLNLEYLADLECLRLGLHRLRKFVSLCRLLNLRRLQLCVALRLLLFGSLSLCTRLGHAHLTLLLYLFLNISVYNVFHIIGMK